MRFSVLVVGAFAALVSAQTTTPAAAATQTYPLDPAQSSALACLDKCEAGNVDCQSKCIQVPAPNDKAVNDTTKCVAECPQGDGSEAETQKYADCSQACIKKYYFDSTTGATPSQAGSGNGNSGNSASSGAAAPTGTKTGVVASITNSAGSVIASASSALESAAASASAAVTSTTPNAAPAMAVGSAAIFGLVAAVFAL